MKHCFRSWRTTLLGVGAILTALGDISYQIGSRDWHLDRLGADAMGICTGLGLIFAQDDVVSTRDHQENSDRIDVNTRAIAEAK